MSGPRKVSSRRSRHQVVAFRSLPNLVSRTISGAQKNGEVLLKAFHKIIEGTAHNISEAALKINNRYGAAEIAGKRIKSNPARELDEIAKDIKSIVLYTRNLLDLDKATPYKILDSLRSFKPGEIFHAAILVFRMIGQARGGGKKAEYARHFLDAIIQESFYLNSTVFSKQSYSYEIVKYFRDKIINSVYGIETGRFTMAQNEKEVISALNLSIEEKNDFMLALPELRAALYEILKKDDSHLIALAIKKLCRRGFFYEHGSNGPEVGLDLELLSLYRIEKIKLSEKFTKNLKNLRSYHAPLSPKQLLLGHLLWNFAFPLSPQQSCADICTGVRAISYFSQHNPKQLSKMLSQILKTGYLTIKDGGNEYKSPHDIGPPCSLNYDAVTYITAPHFHSSRSQAAYNKRAKLRVLNPSGIVNQLTLGKQIPKGFAYATDNPGRLGAPVPDCPKSERVTCAVKNELRRKFERFVTLFYITHHPDYRKGKSLPFPLPADIFLSDPINLFYEKNHAILIQRVERHRGQLRVYFYDPLRFNDNYWRMDAKISHWGHGEMHRESSLPFYQFAAMINFFHYDPTRLPKEKPQIPADKMARIWRFVGK